MFEGVRPGVVHAEHGLMHLNSEEIKFNNNTNILHIKTTQKTDMPMNLQMIIKEKICQESLERFLNTKNNNSTNQPVFPFTYSKVYRYVKFITNGLTFYDFRDLVASCTFYKILLYIKSLISKSNESKQKLPFNEITRYIAISVTNGSSSGLYKFLNDSFRQVQEKLQHATPGLMIHYVDFDLFMALFLIFVNEDHYIHHLYHRHDGAQEYENKKIQRHGNFYF